MFDIIPVASRTANIEIASKTNPNPKEISGAAVVGGLTRWDL
jgi:hypothetical protein